MTVPCGFDRIWIAQSDCNSWPRTAGRIGCSRSAAFFNNTQAGMSKARRWTRWEYIDERSWIIGLDIGGTFTDVVMVHPSTRAFHRFKCLTTPEDPARGALAGVDGVLAEAGAKPEEVAVLLHATTLVSNALIERKGRANRADLDQGLPRCAQDRTGEEIRYL